jgi:transcriptional antiterminator RfaH
MLDKISHNLNVISDQEEVVPDRIQASVHKTKSWYLVHLKPRQENVALANLERQGYECYLPKMRIERIRRSKIELITEPMFLRYLFIRLDSSDQGKSWSPIRSTLGVSQLVTFGGRAAKVDDTLIDILRERERILPKQNIFRSGDWVMITDGPFVGLEAIYQTMDAKQRAFILIEILANPVPMEIDAGRLKKVGITDELCSSHQCPQTPRGLTSAWVKKNLSRR